MTFEIRDEARCKEKQTKFKLDFRPGCGEIIYTIYTYDWGRALWQYIRHSTYD